MGIGMGAEETAGEKKGDWKVFVLMGESSEEWVCVGSYDSFESATAASLFWMEGDLPAVIRQTKDSSWIGRSQDGMARRMVKL